MPPMNPHEHDATTRFEERTAFCMRCRAVRTVKRQRDWWDLGNEWDSPVGWWIYGLFAWVVWCLYFLIPIKQHPWRCASCGEVVPLGQRWLRGRDRNAPRPADRGAPEPPADVSRPAAPPRPAPATSTLQRARGYCGHCRREVAAVRMTSDPWACVECGAALPFVKPER